ncbi:MAG: NUDIX hydrolase [Chloroflexi bacterium]|nr:NUDIX hydrolase [Chloroflexota bacterium]
MTRTQKQPVMVAANKRPFAASAVALQAIIINEQEQVLLLSSPQRNLNGEWQIISGGLEAEETVLDGVLRETAEEAGEGVMVRPLTVIHTQTFHYDEEVPYMIGIYYLLAYEGGTVVPGDDMVDSDYCWWSLDALKAENVKFHPSTHMWMLERAVELYRLLKDRPVPQQQPLLD